MRPVHIQPPARLAALPPGGGPPPGLPPLVDPPLAHRGRRRIAVFLGVLLPALVAGLVWDYSRPAEYRTSLRLAVSVPQTSDPAASGGTQEVLSPAQYVTATAALERVAQRLRAAGSLPATLGADPVPALRAMVRAESVPDTNVVQLWAEGGNAELLAGLLNGIAADYRDHLLEVVRKGESDDLARAREETAALKRKLEARRLEVEEYSRRNNIVSSERDENQTLARIKGLSTSLNTAHEKEVAAEAKVRTLREAQAEGRTVVRSRDDPSLAALEQRLGQLREDLQESERGYTARYLELDPKVRAQRARIASLEAQIASRRQTSAALAMQEAEEELASAHGAAARIEQQIEDQRGNLREFAARFERYTSLKNDLAQLEGVYRASLEQVTRMEAAEKTRHPEVQVLEPASVPRVPVRPDYERDALLVAGGSLLLALIATWLVDFLTREPAGPTLVIPQTLVQLGAQHPAIPGARPVAIGDSAPAPQLAPPPPRELLASELGAMLEVASGTGRSVIAALLTGLTAAEAAALRPTDYDAQARLLRVTAASPRTLELPPAAGEWFRAPPGNAADGPLLAAPDGSALTAADIDAMVTAAALDAGLPDAEAVNAETVRKSYLLYLLRQGLRFSDLPSIAGRLSQAELAQLGAVAGSTARQDRARVELLHPALQPPSSF